MLIVQNNIKAFIDWSLVVLGDSNKQFLKNIFENYLIL